MRFPPPRPRAILGGMPGPGWTEADVQQFYADEIVAVQQRLRDPDCDSEELRLSHPDYAEQPVIRVYRDSWEFPPGERSPAS